MANSKTRARLLIDIAVRYLDSVSKYASRCRLCAESDVIEVDLLLALRRLIDDGSFRTTYGRHCGLCLPHLKLLFDLNISKPDREWILDTFAGSLRDDVGRLQRISTTTYFGTAKEDRAALRRCTEMFAGRRAGGF